MPAGRPSDYSPEILPVVAELALAGATDEEIADSIEVNKSTLYRWKHRYPEFREALKSNKELCDERIERTLFKKASEGDVTSMIFWLKNRKSQEWRDRTDHSHSGPDGGPVQFSVKSILEESK